MKELPVYVLRLYMYIVITHATKVNVWSDKSIFVLLQTDYTFTSRIDLLVIVGESYHKVMTNSSHSAREPLKSN